jgi:hypothetical protein
MPELSGAMVDFCGEEHRLDPDTPFVIGREGDLEVDDNPYLHRRFLMLSHDNGIWWLANIGSQLSATVSDSEGGVQAWLAPGARLPVVFRCTTVRFTAGPTTYELEVVVDQPTFMGASADVDVNGETTIGPMPLTMDQRLLVVALAEPLLRGDARNTGSVPTSAEASQRLGWTITKFNRKLDNVCQKLARIGVQGVHGEPGSLASNRRARLVEYALAVRMVGPADLALLDDIDGVKV